MKLIKYLYHALTIKDIVCIDDRFTKSTIIYRGGNPAYKFIKTVLEEYKYCKK